MTFPIQLSELIKSLNLGSNVKKLQNKPTIFHLKIDFYKSKINFLILNKVYSDRFELDLFDEAIRIQNYHCSQKL